MSHNEHTMQCGCFDWFQWKHRKYQGLLFAVPNGGARNKATAAKMKMEGVVAGVADLLLLIPAKGCHGLCIELKNEKGRQSPAQKEWEAKVEAQGYKYVVVRGYYDFTDLVDDWIESAETPRPVGSHD